MLDLMDRIPHILAPWLRPLGTLLLWWILDRGAQRLLGRLAHGARSRWGGEENGPGMERRIDTLEHLARPLLRVVLGALMGLSTLGALGIDLRPVLAGLGVVSLGVSLAAQNILRDFLNGFFVVLENQYNVGDVVTLGGFSGVVEGFTLRATRLRNLDGELIILPNGAVTTVVNQTKGWSVAKVEVGIPYEADVRAALGLLEAAGAALREECPQDLLEPPNVQGIVDFGASQVLLRALLKTPPGQHWEVGRRYRLKLKELFDREGMEFAYPHLDLQVRGGSLELYRGTARRA